MKHINPVIVICAVVLIVMACIWPFDPARALLAFVMCLLAVLFGALMMSRTNQSGELLLGLIALVLALVSFWPAAKAFLAGGQNGGHALGICVMLLILYVATVISLAKTFDRRQAH